MSDTIPDALEQTFVLPENDFRLVVYEGTITLMSKDNLYDLRAQIFYSLSGEIELRFYAETEGVSLNVYDEYLPFSIKGKKCGSLLVTKLSYNSTSGVKLEGIVGYYSTINDDQILIARWYYINLPQLFGDIVRRDKSFYRDRLVFKDGDFQIIVENASIDKNKTSGSNAISTICEISQVRGGIYPFDAVLSEIVSFTYFVSFIFGRRVAPFFIECFSQKGHLSQYHRIGHNSYLNGLSSIIPDFHDKDMVNLWTLFRAKSTSSIDDKDILNTAVHWYLEANMNSGMLEGAFILAMTGIELMYNVLLGNIRGGKKNLEDKLRMLIQLLCIDKYIDSVELASMRNCLVHYGQNNRKHYSTFSIEKKHLLFNSSLFLLEISILYWLGYQGRIKNRLSPSMWKGDGVVFVPYL